MCLVRDYYVVASDSSVPFLPCGNLAMCQTREFSGRRGYGGVSVIDELRRGSGNVSRILFAATAHGQNDEDFVRSHTKWWNAYSHGDVAPSIGLVETEK